jgi:hypothetical protein
VIAELKDVVDELAGLDPSELSDPAIVSTRLALRAQMDRLDGVFALLAVSAHRRGVGGMDGAATTAAWLRAKAGMREGDAKAAIAAGEVSVLLEETGAAWRAGEISSGAARTIVGARVDGHDDALIGSEPVLLDLARRGSLRDLQRAAGHFRSLALANGSLPGEQDGLYLSRGYDGVTVISGELTDAGAETVVTAIHAYTDPPALDDRRTPAQRRAAALVQICQVAIEHAPQAGRAPARVSVVVDWKTLTEGQVGRLDGEFTGAIHPEEVRRLLCDSAVSRIVTDPESLPLDGGRSRRTIPAAIHRAVVARDGGCRFPGCDRPPGWRQTITWCIGSKAVAPRS